VGVALPSGECAQNGEIAVAQPGDVEEMPEGELQSRAWERPLRQAGAGRQVVRVDQL
jgi:hypothetical protein